MENEIEDPSVQRALVLQGGGALGAYEAGVYHVLYHWIKMNLEKENRNENIFDIIAGTSIGGINATIIISRILENKEKDKNHTPEQKKNRTLYSTGKVLLNILSIFGKKFHLLILFQIYL